jgi:polyisoprenoid-binding protein YceI
MTGRLIRDNRGAVGSSWLGLGAARVASAQVSTLSRSRRRVHQTLVCAASYFGIEANDQPVSVSFKSKKVTKAAAAGHFDVLGDLTMHGVTKQVTFDVTAPSEVTAMGVTKWGADATATINRKDSASQVVSIGVVVVFRDQMRPRAQRF